MPTYLYKSAKIRKALDEVDKDEVFLFTDVDVQYFQPIHQIVTDCMASGADIIFQKEFEDIGLQWPRTQCHWSSFSFLCFRSVTHDSMAPSEKIQNSSISSLTSHRSEHWFYGDQKHHGMPRLLGLCSC